MSGRGEMVYAVARAQHSAHDLLLRAVKESGMNVDELADAAGLDTPTVALVLRNPGSSPVSCIEKIIYAATGSCVTFSIERPAGWLPDGVSFLTPKTCPEPRVSAFDTGKDEDA